jgi:hypothetical protein
MKPSSKQASMSDFSGNTADKKIGRLVHAVEQCLSRYYSFAPLTAAGLHLVPQSEVQNHLPGHAESTAQGSVIFSQCDQTSDLFMGIAFSNAILENIQSLDPFERLSSANINACCVVIEEVSHFHLLANRAAKGHQVSHLELEWQGEVDKLLVCALFLQEQCGDAHLLPLARQIYDFSNIYVTEPTESERYWEATRFAAQFWYGAIGSVQDNNALLHDHELRKVLRRAYASSWSGKLEATARPALHKAS